jgi:hypothetical protein
MLTISSIAVAPAPQSTPTVRAQPVTPARPSNAVARENAAGGAVAPQGEAARVQAQAAPPVLAPVTPAQEGQRADGFANAAAPERAGLPPPTAKESGLAAGAEGGGLAARVRAAEEERRTRETEEAQAQRRLDERAQQRAVQADPARARGARGGATPNRAEGEADFPEVKNPALERLDTQIKELLPNIWKASRAAVDMVIGEEAIKAAQERAQRLEELQARLNTRPLANLPPDEAAQTYGEAAQGESRPAPGSQLDRLV